MLQEMRLGLPFHTPLQIFVSGGNGPAERRMLSLLIEDKTKHEISYVDYLCAVHRRIQQVGGRVWCGVASGIIQ